MQLAGQARQRSDFAASLRYAQKIFDLTDEPPGPDAFKGYLALGHHYASLGQDAAVAALMLDAESYLSNASISDICGSATAPSRFAPSTR